MINPANEAFGQARQGSVAAIIQILNERLADEGIRTRAVVSDNMLQLLCEAATAEQLEKSAVVERVRQILENINPQRIKKVKINSRIVKEEQLLWLEEINRDPEKALLWSEIITLKQPFFIRRWIRDRHLKPAGPIFKDISAPERTSTPLAIKIFGAVGLALLLLGIGWIVKGNLVRIRPVADSTLPENTELPEERSSENTAEPAVRPESSAPAAEAVITEQSDAPVDATSNAFVEAVRIAEQAAIDGQAASSAAEWLALAARWQEASDLMSEVPTDNEQYAIAQDRLKAYKANSEAALQQATSAE
ncbi:MAG: hypothetical protein WBC73_04670 [Phormidesmis sp.]